MIRLLALPLIAVVLASCSVAKPMNEAITATEQLIHYYDGDITSLLRTAPLDSEEIKRLDNAVQSASRIRANFERYKNDPRTIPANSRILEIEYNRLKNSYLDVRSIALNHQDYYDANTWATFEIFDLFAQELDVAFSDTMSSVRANESITNTIYLANSIIRIVALI